jgi:tetratricopeptide (TPR) repeat protein
VQVVALDVLPRLESIALLRKHRPDMRPDDPTLDAIAEALGDLPLALQLAGSFLARYQHTITPTAYLAQLRDKALLEHPSLQGKWLKISPTNHEFHVGKTFALSYDKLDLTETTDGLALALLARTACFFPGVPIPRHLLLATLDLSEGDLDASLHTEDALKRLTELGLLEEEAEGALLIHRLVAAFVEQIEPDTEAREIVEKVMLQELANSIDTAGYIEPIPLLLPHLRALVNVAQKRGDEREASLDNSLGYYLDQIGDYPAALPYYQRALEIREEVLGPKHPSTATSLNNLAGLLY